MMGVRVRLSRNSSMYVPFWLAIPVGILWVCVVLVWGVLVVLWSLAVVAGRGCRWAWRRARPRPPTGPVGY
jgi:hypothetical protein